MVKKLMVTLAGLAFCAVALAGQGDPGGPNNGAGPSSTTGGSTFSRARYDQVLGRLGLTDEQIRKIDAIFVAYDKKVRKLYEKINSAEANKRAAYAKYREQQKALYAERDKKIFEVLTAEQQKKYELARKLLAEDAEKRSKLYVEIRAAYKDAGRDREKRKAVQKKYAATFRTMREALQKALDTQIGKLPKRPRGTNPDGGVWQGRSNVPGGA